MRMTPEMMAAFEKVNATVKAAAAAAGKVWREGVPPEPDPHHATLAVRTEYDPYNPGMGRLTLTHNGERFAELILAEVNRGVNGTSAYLTDYYQYLSNVRIN